ncbi:phosphoribosylglycinamide formyltransferase [bacterium]|nr:phosphoribosylglycinamide formyltransferase [bacterium]
MKNIAIFISGRGTNLQAIIDYFRQSTVAQVALVFSNKKDAYGLIRAKRANIPTFSFARGDFNTRDEFIKKLKKLLSEHRIDIIALAGYTRKVPPEIIQEYRHRIVNIHPALLPFFGGKGFYGIEVHRRVLASGMKLSGVTIHFVNEEYDRGEIIYQECVPILFGDTPETLQARVLEREHYLYPRIIEKLATGKISVIDNKVRIDGQID